MPCLTWRKHDDHTKSDPWQDGEPIDADLLNTIKARRPGGELIGIDRILLKSFPLATGWNELMVRVRQQFSLSLE